MIFLLWVTVKWNSAIGFQLLSSVGLVDVGNLHVPYGSLYLRQTEDVFHQLGHFGACEFFDLRGKALNRAAQIAKAVGAFLPFAFLQIFLSVLQTLQLVLFLW